MCPDARHVYPRAEHAGVPRIIIIIRPSLPTVVGMAAVAFSAVHKATERATNREAVIPGEEAPYGRRFGIVAWDREKIYMGVAGTHCLKGIILSRHCCLPKPIDCHEHSHSVPGCQGNGSASGDDPEHRQQHRRAAAIPSC
jgi:hypothetical protein